LRVESNILHESAGQLFLFFESRLGRFSLSSPFISIDVEGAVEAATKREKGWPVGVKTLSATGATDNAGKHDHNNKENNPGDKNEGGTGFIVGRIKSPHHCRQVGDDHQPERPAPLADFLQPGLVFSWVYGVVLFHLWRSICCDDFYEGAILLIL